MLSLLVVDDELIIADGLYMMLQEHFSDRLTVRRCYSAAEASQIMEKNRIDILMTDIEMPGGTGLDLHQSVMERWPLIRVIYLTGYSDFGYVRRALEQNAVAYVLKSDGDQEILDAVEKAIASYERESMRLLHTEKNNEDARHLRHLVYHAMYGGTVEQEQLEWALTVSGLAFSPTGRVCLGYAYFGTPVTTELLHQSMQLIGTLLGAQMPVLCTTMNARSFCLLFEPSDDNDWNVLQGNLEAVQRLLEQQDCRLTICLSPTPIAWTELNTASGRLLEMVNRVSPASGELLTLVESSVVGAPKDADSLLSLRQIKENLLTGQSELLEDEMQHFWSLLEKKDQPRLRLQLCAMLRDMLKKNGMSAAWLSDEKTIRRLSPADFRLRTEALMQTLLKLHAEKQSRRQLYLVHRIDQYILEHIGGDLSLTVISEVMHFHPTYISRMYKEVCGVSLTDAIAKQRLAYACDLLRSSDQSIASIAAATGFTTANYFARWFRKWMGCTAQEYREQRH